MNSIEKRLAILSKLDKVCTKILKQFVTLSRDITEEENDVMENIQETFPNKDKDSIESVIQDICLELIGDAQTVKKELGQFARFISRDVETIEEVKAPFLTEVWSGDVYDDDRFDALSCLHKDLEESLGKLSEEFVQERAVELLG